MFLLMSMPFLMILAIQEEGTLVLRKDETIEDILPYLLAECTEEEFEMETIKAMAVIWRSNLLSLMEDKLISIEQIREDYVCWQQETYVNKKAWYTDVFEACKATKGEVLTYQGKVCYCPYFYASSGMTRDAFSFWEDERFSYMIAVPSYHDEEYESYRSYFYVSFEELRNVIWEYRENNKHGWEVDERRNTLVKAEEDIVYGIEMEENVNGAAQLENEAEANISGEIEKKVKENATDTAQMVEVLEVDEAGYVKWVKVADQIIGGDIFRYCLGLSSSCFSIEQKNDMFRILCKGRGHGFGFSQYGANVMAKEGKTYNNLLKHYFPELHIEKNV